MRRLHTVVVIGGLCASCGGDVVGVTDALSLTVLPEIVALVPGEGEFTGSVEYEFRNGGSETLSLPHCEGAFAAGLEKREEAGTWIPVWGRVTSACWTNPPISIEPGSVYVDQLDVTLVDTDVDTLSEYRVVWPDWFLGQDRERIGPPIYSGPFAFSVP